MNFSSGNLNQVQLDMLGANQAMKMQKSGKAFNKKATVGVVAAALAVILLIAGILAATSSTKTYVYYNGTLYLGHHRIMQIAPKCDIIWLWISKGACPT